MTDTQEVPASLTHALAFLQQRLPDIKRSETAHVIMKSGETYDYTYAGLANISREILPILGELGLSFTCRPTSNAEGKFVLAYELMHITGDKLEGEYPLSGQTAQAVGSSITYARRYTLCAITGLAPDDDDDAAAVQAEQDKTRGTVQRRPVAHPPPRTVGEGRTVQRAAKPPLPGETGDSPSTPDQWKTLHAQATGLGWSREVFFEWAAERSGKKDLTTTKDLTQQQAANLITIARALVEERGANNDVDKGTDTPPNPATETVKKD